MYKCYIQLRANCSFFSIWCARATGCIVHLKPAGPLLVNYNEVMDSIHNLCAPFLLLTIQMTRIQCVLHAWCLS